jgi:hypothetical protein
MDPFPKNDYDVNILLSFVLKYLVSNILRNCIWALRE